LDTAVDIFDNHRKGFSIESPPAACHHSGLMQMRNSLKWTILFTLALAAFPLPSHANGARRPQDPVRPPLWERIRNRVENPNNPAPTPNEDPNAPHRPSLWERIRGRRDNPTARSAEVFVTNSEILSDFQVRGANGQMLPVHKPTSSSTTGTTSENSYAINTGVNPTEAAKTLCGDPDVNDAERMNKQSQVREGLLDLILRLESAAVPRSLTATESTLLTQTPICEPFIAQLQTITQYLKEGRGEGPIVSDGDPGTRFDSMLFRNDGDGSQNLPVRGVLELRAGGESVSFNLAHALTFNRKGMPVGLETMGTPAAATGQNIGVDIQVSERLHSACQTSYNLTFTGSDGAPLARTRFTVNEIRCD
jgi:hypothetical protein